MRLIIALLAVLALPALGLSATIVVPVDHATIQDAINAASNGDLILVKPGTYFENIDFTGKLVEVRSDMDVVAATKDLAPETTVINGGQLGSVATFTTGEGPAAILQGFTITNGSGTWVPATLTNDGGGIFIDNASPTIEDCLIRLNTADKGAGLMINNSFSLIRGNTFQFNQAAGDGGAIVCDNSASPTIINNVIAVNTATGNGGGVVTLNFAAPVLNNNHIKFNQADKGGGVYCDTSSPKIKNNIIKGNNAKEGAAGFHFSSDAIWTNNTLFDNAATVQGGGLDCEWFAFPKCHNNIIWANTAPADPQIAHDGNSMPTVEYCDIQGGTGQPWFGVGCIDNDPLFLDPVTKINLHLSPGSPCIDAGNNAAPQLPVVDYNFESRIDVTTVDIGADEFYNYDPAELHVPSQYLTIQDAIDAAPSGGLVLVQPEFQNEGKYVETIDFLGKDITVRSDVDADPATRDIDPAGTVIDGNAKGSVVTFANGETIASVLEGFTLTGGTGTLNIYDICGGGIFCDNSSPKIVSNVIDGNTADYGGGIYAFDSSPTITGNTIQNNTVTVSGGGIMGTRCDSTITQNLIRNNTGVLSGGGIELNQFCDAMVSSNMLYENRADFGGGCADYRSNIMWINNTLVNNNAIIAGGGFYVDMDSMPTIKNTILNNNSAATGAEVYTKGYSTTTLDFSCVSNGLLSVFTAAGSSLIYGLGGSGINMIDSDPVFLDPANNNYNLGGIASPCINRGNNADTHTVDFYGAPRVNNTLVDMGADEFFGAHAMTADSGTLSAGSGGTVNLSLDAGPSFSGRQYHVLGAVFGSAPSTPLPGGAQLPLFTTGDPIFPYTISLANTPLFANFQGQLDVNGHADASLNSGVLDPGAVGAILYLAYTILSPFEAPSNVVGVEIVP
jgi:hypothetical protein